MFTLDKLSPSVRPLATKVVEEVRTFRPGIVVKPTTNYLGLYLGRRLVCAITPLAGGFGLRFTDYSRGRSRPVWRNEHIVPEKQLKPLIGEIRTLTENLWLL